MRFCNNCLIILFIIFIPVARGISRDFHFINQVQEIINGSWIDLSTGVLIEFQYPSKNEFYSETGVGEFRYYQTNKGMKFQFGGGEINPVIENGVLLLYMVHNNDNSRETIRVDFYRKDYLELYYIDRFYKVFLNRIDNISKNRSQHHVKISSDPSNCAVYLNGEYLGETPLVTEIVWETPLDRKEMIFEKSGYITNRRQVLFDDENVHIILHPFYSKE